MHLAQEDTLIVRDILNKYIPEYEVWAFGSRVHGCNLKKFSDLDLAIINQETVDAYKLFELKEAFSESNLPMMVDVLTWHDIDKSFQEIILQDYEVIQKKDET